MLHKVKEELTGDKIAASDGEIGRIDEVYFDDEAWRVRYLVVDTGGWLGGRKVLISPLSVDRAKSGEEAIAVGLSREQVEHSPGVDADKPVSRQYEEAYARYYGHPLYWAPPEAFPIGTIPGPKEARALKEAERKAAQSHLRASSEVIGYSILAADGAIGHVDDILIDDRNWAIADLVVDTRNWLPGKKVRVPPSAVDAIDWKSREVKLRVRREEIEQGIQQESDPQSESSATRARDDQGARQEDADYRA
jgi:sporulation protein YlmC with PRC-barrel domain